MKDPDNPVTIADLTIQKSIEYVLTSLYPGINIIGEEDPATYEHIKPLVALSDIKKDTITDEFLLKNFESRKEAISKSKFQRFVIFEFLSLYNLNLPIRNFKYSKSGNKYNF